MLAFVLWEYPRWDVLVHNETSVVVRIDLLFKEVTKASCLVYASILVGGIVK